MIGGLIRTLLSFFFFKTGRGKLRLRETYHMQAQEESPTSTMFTVEFTYILSVTTSANRGSDHLCQPLLSTL